MRREVIAQSLYSVSSKEFLDAGKRCLAGDTARTATTDEVKDLRRESSAGSEVLDARHERAQEPRRRRHRDRRRRCLKGFPDAIKAVFPQTVVQTCIVHLIRNMSFASWKDRKAVASALRSVYRAENARRA